MKTDILYDYPAMALVAPHLKCLELDNVTSPQGSPLEIVWTKPHWHNISMKFCDIRMLYTNKAAPKGACNPSFRSLTIARQDPVDRRSRPTLRAYTFVPFFANRAQVPYLVRYSRQSLTFRNLKPALALLTIYLMGLEILPFCVFSEVECSLT